MTLYILPVHTLYWGHVFLSPSRKANFLVLPIISCLITFLCFVTIISNLLLHSFAHIQFFRAQNILTHQCTQSPRPTLFYNPNVYNTQHVMSILLTPTYAPSSYMIGVVPLTPILMCRYIATTRKTHGI